MREHYMFVDWNHLVHPGAVLHCYYIHNHNGYGPTARKEPGDKVCDCPGLEAERAALLARTPRPA